MPRRSGQAPPRRGRPVSRHPTRHPRAPRPGRPGPTSTRSVQSLRWRRSDISPPTSDHDRARRRSSTGPLAGSNGVSRRSAGRSGSAPSHTPAGVSWGVPVPARALDQPGRDPGPRPPARTGSWWARTSTPSRRHPALRTTPPGSACCWRSRGGRRAPDPAARSCSSPSGPRSRAARPTTTTTTAPAPTSRRWTRRAPRRCAGMVSLDRVGVGRSCRSAPPAGRDRAARGAARRGPARRRPGRAGRATAPATTGRSCATGCRAPGWAARRTPATTRPATCRPSSHRASSAGRPDGRGLAGRR